MVLFHWGTFIWGILGDLNRAIQRSTGLLYIQTAGGVFFHPFMTSHHLPAFLLLHNIKDAETLSSFVSDHLRLGKVHYGNH